MTAIFKIQTVNFLLFFLKYVHTEYPKFPLDFKFGVATAAFQIEGAWNVNGKGENIWDHITHERPDWTKDHTNGDIACDSYHRWEEDIKIIKGLGVNYYRFSLSWSRILPNGFDNKINPDGLLYYNKLIDELLRNEIEPMVTLYHWDLPQPLQELGGWTNALISEYFEDYARVAFEQFGNRVKTWITINEPPSVCESSYGRGDDAPGILSPGIGDYLCGRTLLLAHARAYHLYNDRYKLKQKGTIGITIDAVWREPRTNSSKDIDAAERSMQMDLGWWAHPIFSKHGDYPSIMKERIAHVSKSENFTHSRLPPFSEYEVNFIRGTYDFFGLNHYSSWLVSDFEYPVSHPTSYIKDIGIKQVQDPSWQPSAAQWLKVVPWGFRKLLKWIKNEYGNPLVYITENGYADIGELNDIGRINYHNEYMKALLKAIRLDKCNVKAYTIWSVLDNMEWKDGYTLKFGLYKVDFDNPNRTRTAKASAKFYSDVVKTRTLPKIIKL